jgi:hypothetical protein
MFMQPISLATVTPLKPKPRALKLAAGAGLALVGAAVMVPWALFVGAWTVLCALGKGAKAVGENLVWAGESVVGR